MHVYNYGHPYVNVWDLSRSIGPTRKKCIPRRKAPAAPYKEKEKIVQFLLLGPFTIYHAATQQDLSTEPHCWL